MRFNDSMADGRRWLETLGALARRKGRCVWRTDTRVHIGLKDPPLDQLGALAQAVETELSALRGVRWVQINAALGVVVVAFEPRRLPRPRGSDARQRLERFEDRLVDAIDRVEQAQGLERKPFRTRNHPENHPGDWWPLARTLAELGLDLGSIVGGLALRRAGIKPVPIELDMAALLDLVGNVPLARKWVERRIGIARTELALGLAGAVSQTLLHGEIGAAASSLHRLLRLRELRARRRLWPQWESQLCSDAASTAATAARAERPQPLPDGPIERYAGKAAVGALGAFAGSLLATGRQDAAAAIVAGVPKPARLGREAYAAHLGWRLARAGVLVVEPQVLRRLDRIDCVVLGTSVRSQSGDLRALSAAAQRAGIQCIVIGAVPEGVRQARAFDTDAAEAVRTLQAEGRGVLFVGCGPDPAYLRADCGVALLADRGAPPWGAAVLCPGGVEQGVALIDAVALAHRAAEQSMDLSLAEVVLGIVLSSAGLDERATRRILLAVSSTSILAMANGVRLAHELQLPVADAAATVLPRWHEMSVDAVLVSLETSEGGLSAAAAQGRRGVPPRQPTMAAQLAQTVWAELSNPMAPVLAVGAGLSAASGGAVDAALILATLAINGIYGGAQRFRTERVVRRLARHETARVRVRRGGQPCAIEVTELVVGDVVLLVSGDTVPADCRIVEAHALEVDESSLTGESLPVAKAAEPCAAADVAERRSMLYDGTSIAAGTAAAVVVALGGDTESGRAGAGAAGPAVGTGVETRLQDLTRFTAPVAAGAGLLLASVGRVRGRPVQEVLGTAVSLAVAAVPEGLPLLAGLAQATVAGRLSRRGALVRDPRAIEALGRMNVLCADKTGTLTEGSIGLRVVSDGASESAPDHLDDWHRRVLAAGLRASPSTTSGAPIAHLTDRALVDGANHVAVGSHDGLSDWQRLHELPFEPGRAFHAGLAQHRDGRLISVKGAPEKVLPRCTHWARPDGEVALTPAQRAHFSEQADALARRGFRVLAVAERVAHEQRPVDDARVQGLRFCGFIGFADGVRPTARAAVDDLRRAGIKVAMLTGDHPMTAYAIACELGIDDGLGVLTGGEIDSLDDDALAARVAHVSVFARVTPAHKVRIVRAFQRAGKVVGMTGDGANDAPAIRLAEVGIALGEHSTAAARAAADLVVTDGRIETIVAAVLEGRALWLSVRDAVSLLVGGNLGEILFTVASSLGGTPALNARQLLLVNLLTDAIPALAVALRPPTGVSPEALLRAGPEASLGSELYREIGWRATATAAGAMSAWLAARYGGNRGGASTVALLALTGTQLAQTLVTGRGSRAVMLSSVASAAALLAAVEAPGASAFFGSRPAGPLGLLQAGAGAAVGVATSIVLPRIDRWVRARRQSNAEASAASGGPAPPPAAPARPKPRAGQAGAARRSKGRRGRPKH